jgi:hypothetical protein
MVKAMVGGVAAFLFGGLLAPGQAAFSPAAVTKQLICDGPKACGVGYINGHVYETLVGDKKVAVSATVQRIGKYARIDLFVLNDSETSIDVLPANFVLSEVTPKQKVFKYVDGDKLIRSSERRLALGNAMTAIGANHQQTSSTTTTGTVSAIGSDGTSVMGTYSDRSTTTSPDYAAQARAAEIIRERNEAFATASNFAERVILRANTVPANQGIRGYILYERDKKAKLVMLSGIIGDTIYQFPFEIDLF